MAVVCPIKGKKWIGDGCEAEGEIQYVVQGSDLGGWGMMMAFFVLVERMSVGSP